jgi:phosphocarrier protein
MRQVKLTLVNPLGLHARAAAKFVDAAKAFSSVITIQSGDKFADGKSIMDLLMLGAPVGTEILLLINGDDADQATSALSDLINAGFFELEE